MRKILMRSAMPFAGVNNISDILINNLVGSNAGNLIYQDGVARVVMTNDCEITTIKTSRKFTEEEIEQYNSDYDLFLIPLANAFRTSFIKELEYITDLVRHLHIPCVVVGVGLQFNLNYNQQEKAFDSAVKEFVQAVLEKSSVIGLRGEITADYLSHLGFRPEKDFTVIGCPSMYTYGDALPSPRLTDLTPKSNIAVNYKADLPRQLYDYIYGQSLQFEHCTFVSQVIKEIGCLYLGRPYPQAEIERGTVPEDYPIHLSNERMLKKEMVGFLDTQSWKDYLGTKDFGFGSRIHGNIANILSGTPCYIFAGDSRVKELAEYHHIPHMSMDDIKEDTNVIDLYHKTDYGCLFDGHKERVTHYLDFLDQNGVEHLDRETLNTNNTPFDRFIQCRPKLGPIYALSTVGPDEMERRTTEYVNIYLEKEADLKDQLRQLNRQYKTESAQWRRKERSYEKELADIKCRKSYKAQVKYDAFRKKLRG